MKGKHKILIIYLHHWNEASKEIAKIQGKNIVKYESVNWA